MGAGASFPPNQNPNQNQNQDRDRNQVMEDLEPHLPIVPTSFYIYSDAYVRYIRDVVRIWMQNHLNTSYTLCSAHVIQPRIWFQRSSAPFPIFWVFTIGRNPHYDPCRTYMIQQKEMNDCYWVSTDATVEIIPRNVRARRDTILEDEWDPPYRDRDLPIQDNHPVQVQITPHCCGNLRIVVHHLYLLMDMDNLWI